MGILLRSNILVVYVKRVFSNFTCSKSRFFPILPSLEFFFLFQRAIRSFFSYFLGISKVFSPFNLALVTHRDFTGSSELLIFRPIRI